MSMCLWHSVQPLRRDVESGCAPTSSMIRQTCPVPDDCARIALRDQLGDLPLSFIGWKHRTFPSHDTMLDLVQPRIIVMRRSPARALWAVENDSANRLWGRAAWEQWQSTTIGRGTGRDGSDKRAASAAAQTGQTGGPDEARRHETEPSLVAHGLHLHPAHRGTRNEAAPPTS